MSTAVLGLFTVVASGCASINAHTDVDDADYHLPFELTPELD